MQRLRPDFPFFKRFDLEINSRIIRFVLINSLLRSCPICYEYRSLGDETETRYDYEATWQS